jgi:hypothetical protein
MRFTLSAALGALGLAGVAHGLPKISRSGKYLFNPDGNRFYIKVSTAVPCLLHVGLRIMELGGLGAACSIRLRSIAGYTEGYMITWWLGRGSMGQDRTGFGQHRPGRDA